MIRNALLLLACLVPGVAQAEWQEGSSRHFVVYSNDSPENVKKVTGKLERFDRTVRLALHLGDPEIGPDARVTVFVLPDTSDVQKMLGDKNRNAAGFYRGSAPAGPLAFVPKRSDSDSEDALSPQQVLQHEYTHHLMYSNWGDVVFPSWFVEGFAELFATAREREDGSVVIGAVPTYRSYGIDKINQFPVEKLVRDAPDYNDAMQAQVFYGRAWLLTHYMMFDPERSKRLANYIAAINSGKSADEATAILGVTGSLDFQMNAYGKRRALPAITLPGSQLPIGDVTARALSPGEAAMMLVRLRSINSADRQRAKALVVEARQVAAPFGNAAGAQVVLAQVESEAGNDAEAEIAADRALAADPKSVQAMIWKGISEMNRADKAGNHDPAVWTRARRWFLAANKADPLYAYPPRLYFESFAQAKQPPSRAAKDGLLYAYKLSPQNVGLRYEAARVLLVDGETKAARVALEPIAYSAHAGAFAARARKAVAALDKDGTAAALAVFDGPL